MGVQERENARRVESKLEEIGNGQAVRRFVSKYGSTRTKSTYLSSISFYFRLLRKQGIAMTPDELVMDNLRCIFGAKPEDVMTKRKHLDWLDRHVNGELVEAGISQATRKGTASAIMMFYRRTDAPVKEG